MLRHLENLEDQGDIFGREREAVLHHRLPSLQARRVDVPEYLDVHQAVADLDVAVVRREQVELVTLLRVAARRELRKRVVGRAEAGAKRTPLPTRDDRGRPSPG